MNYTKTKISKAKTFETLKNGQRFYRYTKLGGISELCVKVGPTGYVKEADIHYMSSSIEVGV